MTTFNAGAIEANLTLGRSSWVRDLRKTQKEIADLERESITIGIDADADNAHIQMSNLEALLEDLDQETYTPTIDLNVTEAQAKLQELEERLDALDRRVVTPMMDADTDNAVVQISLLEERLDDLDREITTIDIDVEAAEAQTELLELMTATQMLGLSEPTINVDVDGYGTAVAQLATLEAQVAAIDGRDIDIDVDVDRAALASLVGPAGGDGSHGYIGLLRILIYAIIALSPVLAVAIGAASAAIIGFTAALAAALGPLLILGAGIAGLVAKYKEAVDAAEGADLAGPVGELQDALERVERVFDRVMDAIAPQGFALMADALDLVASILPALVPLFNATADAMGGVLSSLREWIDSPEFDEMIGFFSGFGIDMMLVFIDIMGDLIRFFGRLFDAIAPFAREMMAGLADVTQGWADWARDLENNEAFQHFVDNALEYGPRVLDMLGSLLDAFLAIGHALEPFAGPMLDALTFLFDLIANVPTGVLTAFIAALAGLWLGFNVLVPVVSAIMGMFAVLPAILGAIFSPLGLLIAAVAGLVLVIIHLWRTNETFRNAVIDTWNAIKRTVVPIVRDIVAAIRENWGSIRAWAMTVWGHIKNIVIDAMIIIRQIVRGVMSVIREIWREHGQDIIRIARWAFGLLGDIIKNGFRFIRGLFQFFRGVFTGDSRQMWEGIKNMWRGAIGVLGAILRGLGDILRAVLRYLQGRWDAFIAWLRRVPGRIGDALGGMWDGIVSGFRSAINTVIGWWNNLSFHLDIPNKIPGLPDDISISTPNVPYLGAEGGFFREPTLSIIGEGKDPEVLAPEPVLREIVRTESGANLDPRILVAAITEAFARVMERYGGITRDELEAILAQSVPPIRIDAGNDERQIVNRIVNGLSFELRRLGFGGKANV